jgi:uncharacterized protein YbcI
MSALTLEQAVEAALSTFHKDQQGVAPERIEAQFAANLLVVRCFGAFTPTERALCDDEGGRKIVQSARRDLRAMNRRQAEAVVAEVLSRNIVRSFYDLDVRVGETMEVYVLDRPI